MSRFRAIEMCVGLVWLAMGVGCADKDTKPSPVTSTEAPEDLTEYVTTEKSIADDPDSTLIPLNEIWGHMIPETQSMRRLEPGFFGPVARKNPEQENPLFLQIILAIKRQTEKNQPLGPGFAVAGTGYEALVAAKEIIVQDDLPSRTFTAGTEVSLFFFTRASRFGLQLKEVKQSKDTVTISYHYPWDSTTGFHHLAATYYLALIPLRKPAVGNIAVNIVELPVELPDEIKQGKYYRPIYKQPTEKVICKSFVFSIAPTGTETAITK